MAEQKPKATRGGSKKEEVVSPVEQAVKSEAVEPEVKAEDKKADKVEAKVLREHEVQLDIHRPAFYQLANKGAKLVVKNKGFGNAYVSEGVLKFGDVGQLIPTGGEKVFDGVELVNFESASQPVLSFIEIE